MYIKICFILINVTECATSALKDKTFLCVNRLAEDFKANLQV